MNPTYGGRPAPVYDSGSLYDKEGCHDHTEILFQSDIRRLHKIFTVKKGSFCVINVNNLSGVTYKVSLLKLPKQHVSKRMFFLNHTDESWHNTNVLKMVESKNNIEIGNPDSFTEIEIETITSSNGESKFDIENITPCDTATLYKDKKCESVRMDIEVLSGVGFGI